MPYVELIKTACSFLLRTQRDDGGIAAGTIDDNVSGIWTTAETLEALLSTQYLDFDISIFDNLIKMVLYLTNRFIPERQNTGYWEITDGMGASIMSTGHVIHALSLFLDKMLIESRVQALIIDSVKYDILSIREEINNCVKKAQNWLYENIQIDNGWSETSKNAHKDSKIFCTYYALRGLNSTGKTCENDNRVFLASVYIRDMIDVTINNKKRLLEGEIANLLYGYIALHRSKYFSASDDSFRRKITKSIRENWKDIYNCTNFENLRREELPFVHNIPCIALNTILTVEDYSFNREIRALINFFVNSRNSDGSWGVKKGDKQECTWVTADVLLIFNQAQSKFKRYNDKILLTKKFKLLVTSNVFMLLLTSLAFLYYLFARHFGGGENESISIINIIIVIVGLASSIITVYEFLRSRK